MFFLSEPSPWPHLISLYGMDGPIFIRLSTSCFHFEASGGNVMSLATAMETCLHKCSVLICSRISSFTVCVRTCLWGCAWAQRCGGQRTNCRHGPSGESHWRNPGCWVWAPWWEFSPPEPSCWPIDFFFFLFLIQGLTLWLRCLQFMTVLLPQAAPVLGLQTALAYIFNSV